MPASLPAARYTRLAVSAKVPGDREDAGVDANGSAGPLVHLKVLDLSRILAGPWAGQLLGDYGADVIKVERPG
ncbi:MAG: CoA transferase, partial [Acetobacteraceae bacterium]|nr:CoA transferase [Acetobacteraceae bacterium]